MADKKISELAVSTVPLAGTEELAIVQSGDTKKATVGNFFDRAVVVNESGADVDFRIESDTNINAFFLDGASGSVGIGTNNPIDSSILNLYKSDASVGPQLMFHNGAGAIGNSGVLGSIAFYSDDNSFGGNAIKASIKAIQPIGAPVRGDLAFYTADENTSITEALRIDYLGNTTINTGNLVISTSGKGIDFSADGSAAGMTSELLDDYEEGTWTPVDVSGAGVALSSVTATYTKVGRSVTYFMEATVASTGSGAVVLIGGLPFAPANNNFVGSFHNTTGNDYVALTNAAGVRINVYPLGSSSVAVWNTLSTATIRATGTYFV